MREELRNDELRGKSRDIVSSYEIGRKRERLSEKLRVKEREREKN